MYISTSKYTGNILAISEYVMTQHIICPGAGLSSSSTLILASTLALLAAYGELDSMTKSEVAQLASRWVLFWGVGRQAKANFDKCQTTPTYLPAERFLTCQV